MTLAQQLKDLRINFLLNKLILVKLIHLKKPMLIQYIKEIPIYFFPSNFTFEIMKDAIDTQNHQISKENR